MTNMFHTISFKNIFFITLVWIIFHSCLSDAHQEKHFLHYKFTVLTKADTFPEFSAVIVADDRQIKHYNNEERVWILTEDDDWTEPPDPPETRNWFISQIRTLTNCINSQCSDHVLQRIIGCELEEFPDGTVNLTVFDEYGFDGEDFISFNSDTMKWIDKNPKAKETKEKWDLHTERNQFIKYFLKNCMNWILTFINTKQSSPDVHVSVRKTPDDDSKLVLTCLATGFYPRDVQMNIRLNRNILEDQTSSGIRPNDDETFQMRISVKIDCNHEGSYDCLLIHSSLTEPVSVKWDGKCAHCETKSQNLPLSKIFVVPFILSLVLVLVLVPFLIVYIWWLCIIKSSEAENYIQSTVEFSSAADKIRKKMMKKTKHHPLLTGQMSSFDDEKGVKIRHHSDRGKINFVNLSRMRPRAVGTEDWNVGKHCRLDGALMLDTKLKKKKKLSACFSP